MLGVDSPPLPREVSASPPGPLPPVTPPLPGAFIDSTSPAVSTATGEKAKARVILAAIRTLQQIEREKRVATLAERQTLARFGGFGPVALSLFPDPVTGRYKDDVWQELGEELRSLLTQAEWDSAKKSTFNAFYTSPVVMAAMHDALARLGVSSTATVLEPGCGIGNFIGVAPQGMRFVGVELDSISGRIARALYPAADIRIENFRDTKLPAGRIDSVIGNVPFADLKLDYHGQRLSLHDFFFAKSVDALKPGGVLALVTSRFTLDRVIAGLREYLGERADFLGAIRLPSDAFHREGTKVVTDIVFLRNRAVGEPANHADPAWLTTGALAIEGEEHQVNGYFLHHPEMVLGTWSLDGRLYDSGYSLKSKGDLQQQLRAAVERLPRSVASAATSPEVSQPPVPAFTPPPPLDHITEGSFFVGDNRIICQLIDGQSQPVNYGGKLLKTDGSLIGRRMAALIGLRDKARRVLQSQNGGWPEDHRKEARRTLNLAYDFFVGTFGPINKTTFGATADGGVIRRMPNLVKFREDPDAMLVMSLEEYDESTGKAHKAAILHKDVVGRTPPITSVRSAEEGLLVSLNQRGVVDLTYISDLYGSPEISVIEELGDLIYRDPETKQWQTADAYLSGNVRAKLAAAELAGSSYARNAEALRAVQPEDVLPGDIDANLGAPWIPADDIQRFTAELFRVPPSSIRIGHLPKDAVWSVDANHNAERSVASTVEYGTPRAGGISLLDLALNLKTPVIYDIIHDGGNEQRVVNQEATLAAREKQKQLKERFRSWVFADPDRTERLVRLYNDIYNNLRPRRFDGAHLDFPGMNQTVKLRPHQEDAVWRGMSSGNTLLAHAVGAGKTFTMAATGMKMKQAGLIKKPMYVVPNHMLEQFAREFMQLYPTAKLLIAGKEDLTRDRRKHLTAKIASGQWDGIIVTHSSFERIGMSRKYQEEFLIEQINEYNQLLIEKARGDESRAPRNIIKALEKQKAKREERLKELLAADKKDDGLVFDELGVDHLFIDEAHYFKNLETPTKMERVAGIQTGGSERAFDLYMKAQFLHQQQAGHGLTFATGTPISNTMVEMYTMQRFLDPEGLRSRGIDHFDAWAATFGEVVDTMEISPDGASLRPRSRFARFTNLPELQQMFRSFADVQTADMLDLPRPRLAGGKATVVACPMSEEQALLQQGLVERYEKLRSQRIDPRADNALAITTDGRKLALDARMLSSTAPDVPGSKVNALVDNVSQIWQRTAATRGTQLVFCDMGVHPTPWGYSAYDEIVRKLIAHGIPREQIAAIGDADSDAKKQALFERVRTGAVRVLLGSTQKMGVGTNVQKRLVALHHLDAPWKPAEVEQREGRILRQGNSNEEVAIYRYVTSGSFDAYMWQALETKARFIAQVITGDNPLRQADDIGGQEFSYAEVKAIASGNPAVLTLAEADAELQRLGVLKRNHADEQYIARRNVRDLPETIDRLTQRLADLTSDGGTATAHADDALIIGDRECRREEAAEILAGRLTNLPDMVMETRVIPLGVCQGLRFGLTIRPLGSVEVYLEGATTRYEALSREHRGPRAVLNALDRLVGSYETDRDKTQQNLSLAESQLRDYQMRLGVVFPHTDYLDELTQLRDQLKLNLSGIAAPPEGEALPTAAELAEQIKTLRGAQRLEPVAVQRLAPRPSAAGEEPVTTRIRRRRGPSPLPAQVAESNQEPSAPAPANLLPPSTGSPADPSVADVSCLNGDQSEATSPLPESLRPKRFLRQSQRRQQQMSLF
jgi:N12 class adenine-specific DNA methylase